MSAKRRQISYFVNGSGAEKWRIRGMVVEVLGRAVEGLIGC